ncbi:MAG: M20/M25/M40 family metallo-hydrolase [Alphaproteobacteria bacterium]|nr:M20/M25/M40 family metallo-hydrolase [Alphaproteobacteria bacterium]
MAACRAALLAIAAGVFLAHPAFAGDALKHRVDAWRGAHETQILSAFDRLLRFPSVAADPKGTAAAGAYLKRQLEDRGFSAELLSVPDAPPVVFGSLMTPGAKRTVVFYAHYDGQPVTPSQWATPPFDPAMRSAPLGSGEHVVDWKSAKPPYDPEWRLYARSAGDDKISQAAFLAAFDALKAIGRKPSVNIKVVWEGEEEAGSTHLKQILQANAGKLSSDLWLIGDGPVHQSRRPLLYFGARGTIGLDATIYGPIKALHDGHYGNWVPNPAAMAAELVSQLRAEDGRVLIPGFMDDVRPASKAERDAIAALPPVEDGLKQEFQIARSEADESVADAIMRPALNVRGIRAGKVGDEAANAIPVDAEVSIDFRLVPNQKPGEIRAQLEAFLRSKGWYVVTAVPDKATRLAHPKIVKIDWEDGYPAFRSDMSSAPARAAIAAANSAADQPVAVVPSLGGSVPLYVFDDVFHAPLVGLPVANHDDNQHAANENIRLQNVWDGIDAYAAMVAELDW